MTTSPSVIVSNYGYYYPRGSYLFNSVLNKPLRTEVLSSPGDYLVTLDQARSWLGLSGDYEADSEIQDLLEAFSDYLEGPDSLTNKCFRQWKFIDFFRVKKLYKSSRIYLSYPIVQGIEEFFYDDYIGDRTEINSSKYRLIKRQLKKSYILILEDIDLGIDTSLFDEISSVELGITYNCSADLDQENNPIIPKKLIQACKHYINDSYYKRGIQLGPFEGAGVQNKLITNLLKSYMY